MAGIDREVTWLRVVELNQIKNLWDEVKRHGTVRKPSELQHLIKVHNIIKIKNRLLKLNYYFVPLKFKHFSPAKFKLLSFVDSWFLRSIVSHSLLHDFEIRHVFLHHKRIVTLQWKMEEEEKCLGVFVWKRNRNLGKELIKKRLWKYPLSVWNWENSEIETLLQMRFLTWSRNMFRIRLEKF